MLDLQALEKQLDEALAKETDVSLTSWIQKKRKEGKTSFSKDTINSNIIGKKIKISFHKSDVANKPPYTSIHRKR